MNRQERKKLRNAARREADDLRVLRDAQALEAFFPASFRPTKRMRQAKQRLASAGVDLNEFGKSPI